MIMFLCNKLASDTETERQHIGYFVVTDCPSGGRDDHIKGSPWIQSSQRDYLFISLGS